MIAANQDASAQRASDFVSQSVAYRYHGNILASQSLQARQAAAEPIQQSFDAGLARGEASYPAGVNNRQVSGLSSSEIAGSVYAQAGYERSIWADGIASGQSLSTDIGDFGQSARSAYNDYIELSRQDSFNARNFGIGALPGIAASSVDDLLIGGAGAIGTGTTSSLGTYTLQSPSGNALAVIARGNQVGGPVITSSIVQNSASERLRLAATGGLLLDAAKRSGAIGAVVSPISTTINASINGDPILAVDGQSSFLGFDSKFATNLGLDFGKGVTSAITGGLVGAAAGSVFPGLGTIGGFAVGFITAIGTSEAIEYQIKDYRPK
ncbi:hypothetical protein OPS25_07175 [Alteromonas ponticola]|uniref:Uncharacterized protein n=1 Tax=Alteromonas aquimaris TaxID=2998417 RepID=A0ABT3P683_9ALTE|nr:hypothetical protein [Alteromonas aquimaris]MCW8108273.1 hypothetical protein [Alteromonas aquimaris]